MVNATKQLLQRILIAAALAFLMGSGGMRCKGPCCVVAVAHNCTYPQQCGALRIQYPFSVQESCGHPDFRLRCVCRPDATLGQVCSPYLDTISGSLQVLEISKNGSLVMNFTDWKAVIDCAQRNVTQRQTFLLPNYSYPFAMSGENYFSAFQCNYGMFNTDYLTYPNFQSIVTPQPRLGFGFCIPDCLRPTSNNPICRNQSCCVSPLPHGARTVTYTVTSVISNESSYPCGGFSIPFYPAAPTDWRSTYGLKLLWALPYNKSSNEAEIKNDPSYACSPNSKATYVSGVPGYYCTCVTGFHGDGFINGTGCEDVNECENPTLNRCFPGRSTCHNNPGKYSCSCKYGVGDGYKDGTGCQIPKHWLITGFLVGFLVCVLLMTCAYLLWRKQRIKIRRRKNFIQNGGIQLQLFIACMGERETARVFSINELKTATGNFADRLKLGADGHGTVYKGILQDGRHVAIKKANRRSKKGAQEFLNEVAILTQINHKHIVRLVGCCLETRIPLLVFEYVPNGSLVQNLRGRQCNLMDWNRRLEIGIQTAEALEYLHSAASPPILHRNVKSSSILLDEDLNVKIADFGVSRLVNNLEESRAPAMVEGTIGYLDPEYFQTFQLTDKSDVYSFGVILVELITGLQPVGNKGDGRNLVPLFIERSRQLGGVGWDIVDGRLRAEVRGEEVMMWVRGVSELAVRCLALRGEERPCMKEVVEELQWVRSKRRRRQDTTP